MNPHPSSPYSPTSAPPTTTSPPSRAPSSAWRPEPLWSTSRTRCRRGTSRRPPSCSRRRRPHFPAGTVHLAVVDPGVGSGRRMLAVRTAAACFVAPDNGLLTPFLDGAAAIRAVERASSSCPARDRPSMAGTASRPVAAFLLRGEPVGRWAPRSAIPCGCAPPAAAPRARGRSRGRVAHVDRYGNLVTDIPGRLAPRRPLPAPRSAASHRRRVTHYAEIPPGRGGDAPRLPRHGRAVDQRRGSGPALERGPGRGGLSCASGTDLELSSRWASGHVTAR